MGTARRTSSTMDALMVTPAEAKKRPKPRGVTGGRGGGGGGGGAAAEREQPIKQNTLPHQREKRNSSTESNRSQQQHNQVVKCYGYWVDAHDSIRKCMQLTMYISTCTLPTDIFSRLCQGTTGTGNIISCSSNSSSICANGTTAAAAAAAASWSSTTTGAPIRFFSSKGGNSAGRDPREQHRIGGGVICTRDFPPGSTTPHTGTYIQASISVQVYTRNTSIYCKAV